MEDFDFEKVFKINEDLFKFSDSDLEGIRKFHKNIDAALEFGIKSALEEKGYKFKDDYDFLKFCIMGMNLYTEVKTEDPYYERYVAKLRGSDEELFSLPVSWEIDFPNNLSSLRLSYLKDKLTHKSE